MQVPEQVPALLRHLSGGGALVIYGMLTGLGNISSLLECLHHHGKFDKTSHNSLL